jgi:hypothetical protein
MQATIAQIDDLISAYDKTRADYQQERIEETIPSMSALLQGFGAMREDYAVWNKKNAERYNIFNILNIRFAETKTHTPFLVNLLDPKGSHGQGLSFFDLFIKDIAPKTKKHLYQDLEISHIRIKEEKNTKDKGRLDIFIECLGGDKRFVIVIENKINAGDQKEQLTRYYNHCKAIGYDDKNILLVYLTKRGKDATDYSMPEAKRKLLKDADVLVDISYKTHVAKALDSYIKALESEKVRFITNQYLDTIKTF